MSVSTPRERRALIFDQPNAPLDRKRNPYRKLSNNAYVVLDFIFSHRLLSALCGQLPSERK